MSCCTCREERRSWGKCGDFASVLSAFASWSSVNNTSGWCTQDPFEHLETYHDNWLDRQFINYFASKMSKQLGGPVTLLHTAVGEQILTSPPSAAFALGIKHYECQDLTAHLVQSHETARISFLTISSQDVVIPLQNCFWCRWALQARLWRLCRFVHKGHEWPQQQAAAAGCARCAGSPHAAQCTCHI